MHGVPTVGEVAPFAVMLTGLFTRLDGYIRNRLPAKFASISSRCTNSSSTNGISTSSTTSSSSSPPSGSAAVLEARRHRHHRPLRPERRRLVVLQGSRVSRRIQSGYLYTYALVMLLGLVAAISWAMVQAR
jgi:NADH-quinone oxidoreductase subunit L